MMKLANAIRARSTGLIQSQAVKAMTTKLILRHLMNSAKTWISTEDITTRPLSSSTVVFVKEWGREIRGFFQHVNGTLVNCILVGEPRTGGEQCMPTDDFEIFIGRMIKAVHLFQ
eukprot:scaffold33581_cov220-Skeletonema_dohrnii-CCMP3373.AAC.5